MPILFTTNKVSLFKGPCDVFAFQWRNMVLHEAMCMAFLLTQTLNAEENGIGVKAYLSDCGFWSHCVMIEGFICNAQENIVGHIGLLHSKAINISALHPEARLSSYCART
jgi:hypothetical protein